MQKSKEKLKRVKTSAKKAPEAISKKIRKDTTKINPEGKSNIKIPKKSKK